MKKLYYQLGTALTVALTSIPSVAAAAGEKGLRPGALADIGTATGATSQDLPTLIGNFINVILGILGILLVVYIIYGGYLYMTPGKDHVEEGKKIMKNAVIGIIIITAAYAISTFVISTIVSATTG